MGRDQLIEDEKFRVPHFSGVLGARSGDFRRAKAKLRLPG